MTNRRKVTATAPDGREVSTTGLGAKRAVGAIRITNLNGDWLVTVHKTLENAISGPNQTPLWNTCKRYAIAVDAADQPAGRWFPASK